MIKIHYINTLEHHCNVYHYYVVWGYNVNNIIFS